MSVKNSNVNVGTVMCLQAGTCEIKSFGYERLKTMEFIEK
jgi:hypothetical protein